MAKQQNTDSLIPVPKKVPFFTRLLGGDGYQEAWEKLSQTAVNVQNEREQLADKSHQLSERLDDLATKEKGLNRREAELVAKEEALKAMEVALKQQAAELKQREGEISNKEFNAKSMYEQGKQALNLYREREDIAPTIPEASLQRDEIFKDAIRNIKISAEKLSEIAKNSVSLTPAEKKSLTEQKADLRAALLATVCAYRDSLTEGERLAFKIKGKSCATFLQELSSKISDETKESWGPNIESKISDRALKMIDSTYKKIARNQLGMKAEATYEGAAYLPFSGNLELTDRRNAGMCVWTHCCEGNDVGINLNGSYAQQPRTSTNIGKATKVEEEFGNLATTMEDWAR